MFVELNHSLDRLAGIPVSCMYCGQLFELPAQRDVHMFNEHVNEETPIIICRACSVNFDCIHDKEMHRCFHGLTYVCDQCPEFFRDEKSLKKHKISQHPPAIPTLKQACDTCPTPHICSAETYLINRETSEHISLPLPLLEERVNKIIEKCNNLKAVLDIMEKYKLN